MIPTFMSNVVLVQSLTSAETPQVDIVSSFAKLIFGMIVILGMLSIFYFLLKKKNLRKGNDIPEELIKVLATRYLGPKKSILLVEIAGNFLTLGVSQDSISLLAKIENPEAEDMLKNYKSGGLTQSFINQLRRVSGTLSSSKTEKG